MERSEHQEPWRGVGLLLLAMSLSALAAAGAAEGVRGRGRGQAAEAPVAAADRGVSARAAAALRDGERIDVNAASEEALRLVPGIGPALAARIVAHRARHGPFRSLRDLQQVRGIGPKTAARLGRWLRFGRGGRGRDAAATGASR